MSIALASSEAFTPRQQEVLTAALNLLVENGDALTMTAVAQRASCSKETLYKWFGGRDGLLTAIVEWQAAKVRVPSVDRESLDRDALSSALQRFAADLLATIVGDQSVALNRVAIAHAASPGSTLGATMREKGPGAIRRRAKAVLEAGRERALLAFEDSEAAYRTFFGLVVRDTQIRLLLGERIRLSAREIAAFAAAATDQFFVLYELDANAKRGE